MINSISFGAMSIKDVMNLKKGDKVYTDPYTGKPNGVYYPEKALTVDSVHFHTKGSGAGWSLDSNGNKVEQGYYLIDAPPEKATLCSIHRPDNLTDIQEIKNDQVIRTGKIQSNPIFDIKDGKVIGINRESKKKREWKLAGYTTMILLGGAVIIKSIFGKKK